VSAKTTEGRGELILQGIGVSAGVAVGEVVVFAQEGGGVPDYAITDAEIPMEIARFEEALIATRHQIAKIQKKVSQALGDEHAGIFDAHLLVVDDRYLIDEVIRELRSEHRNVEFIMEAVADRYTRMLADVEDDYLRERAADVRDVIRRVINNLAGQTIDRMDKLEQPCIAVAHDFSPSDTAGMDRKVVHAFISDMGSVTSHAAIMARALEVPAVVGLRSVSSQVSTGQTVLVDGGKGVVIINPTSGRLLEYARKAEEQKTILCELETLNDKLSETLDGVRIPIAANIELPSEMEGVRRHQMQGVGLFRTEFLFLGDSLPDEQEQFEIYSETADLCAPERLVIRTMDMGGDKLASIVHIAKESNPFLGCRAIRFCLARPDIFKVQLRAVLRAAEGRNVALMYPMISGLDELLQANRVLDECRAELQAEGVPCAGKIPVGVMIEIPSAALTAGRLAPHADFFSIGTNDLIQYTLAVDRVNENVAKLYQPTHLAVLKLIQAVVQAGREAGIPTTVCGQMAASPELVALLIGLGVDELSISPPATLMVKDIIRHLHHAECVELADEALAAGETAEILKKCRALLAKTSPEILELIG
jgi:phosphotransferase system enzyme I (PtsI)